MGFLLNSFLPFAGDPYFANVVSLLHMDGADASTTFTDVTGRTWTANGNAQIDTAQSKFGGASGLFDGTGDLIYTADSTSLRMGSGDFTFEAWFRADSSGSGTFRGIYSKRNSNASFREFSVYLDSDNKINFLATTNGTSWESVIVSASAITHNQWYHLAAVRNGTTFEGFLDGTSFGTDTLSGTLSSSTEDCTIGALGSNGDFPFYGWLDDVRLTKGVARYTSSFTPPTTAFPDS